MTNSERRVQRVRKALDHRGTPRTTSGSSRRLRSASGSTGRRDGARRGTRLRRVSPMHAGMSYERLEELDGIQWPCYDEGTPGRCSCTRGCGRTTSRSAARKRASARRRSSRRSTSSRTSFRCGSRLAAGWIPTTPGADEWLRRRSGAASIDVSPEDAERFGVCGGGGRAGELAAWVARRRSVSTAASGRDSCS